MGTTTANWLAYHGRLSLLAPCSLPTRCITTPISPVADKVVVTPESRATRRVPSSVINGRRQDKNTVNVLGMPQYVY